MGGSCAGEDGLPLPGCADVVYLGKYPPKVRGASTGLIAS